MPQEDHPNFPKGLSIHPLVAKHEGEEIFDETSQEDAIEQYGIAGRVWEAAQLLVDYIELQDDYLQEFDPPCSLLNSSKSTYTIIELGSGTGYVGLKVARYLHERGRDSDLIVLTDLPAVCPLLEQNCDRSRQKHGITNTTVAPLSWGSYDDASTLENYLRKSEGRSMTHVICSDLVYFPHLLAPLLRSLLHLTQLSNDQRCIAPDVIISYKVRSYSKETPFWSALGLWFSLEPVLVRTRPDGIGDSAPNDGEAPIQWHFFGNSDDSEDIYLVIVAHRRTESYDWQIPTDDEALLNGIGANGTSACKGDDTFETLLLMHMQIV